MHVLRMHTRSGAPSRDSVEVPPSPPPGDKIKIDKIDKLDKTNKSSTSDHTCETTGVTASAESANATQERTQKKSFQVSNSIDCLVHFLYYLDKKITWKQTSFCNFLSRNIVWPQYQRNYRHQIFVSPAAHLWKNIALALITRGCFFALCKLAGAWMNICRQ